MSIMRGAHLSQGNYEEVYEKLHTELGKIFQGINYSEMSDYEIRRTIFEYLCKNLEYDYDLLNLIRDIPKLRKQKDFNRNFGYDYETAKALTRDPYAELASVIDDHVGICNAISQYYKLLLEQMGIKTHCVICDDGSSVKHQLNLVYDKDQDTYSFDDITSVIVGKGDLNTFFNYDIEKANSLKQGTQEILDGMKWVVLGDDYVYALVGKDIPAIYGRMEIPDNIASVKGVHK